MRLFVGIPLAAAVSSELAAISRRLRSPEDGLRWSAPESWHITLQFLGNTSPQQYGCLVAQLRELRLSPVPIWLGSLDFFDRAGIFFAGVRTTPELLLLQERVIAATAHCGFIPEARPFQPHITLARSKEQRQGLFALKSKMPSQPSFTRFVAQQFLLYESFLGSPGSRYEIRERFSLGG
jgi:2'-5' RNA ligase